MKKTTVSVNLIMNNGYDYPVFDTKQPGLFRVW